MRTITPSSHGSRHLPRDASRKVTADLAHSLLEPLPSMPFGVSHADSSNQYVKVQLAKLKEADEKAGVKGDHKVGWGPESS